MPDGEIGDKINRLFKTEEKDTSKFPWMRLAVRYTSWHRRIVGCGFFFPSMRPKFYGANIYYADVVILTAMGEEAAVEAKEAPRQG